MSFDADVSGFVNAEKRGRADQRYECIRTVKSDDVDEDEYACGEHDNGQFESKEACENHKCANLADWTGAQMSVFDEFMADPTRLGTDVMQSITDKLMSPQHTLEHALLDQNSGGRIQQIRIALRDVFNNAARRLKRSLFENRKNDAILETQHIDSVLSRYGKDYIEICRITDLCDLAAQAGHLGVLQWARKHGCRWGEKTCAHAAWGGHLDVLQWAREHGCPWDESTCAYAADGGHLEVLRYARAQDLPCPWSRDTCAFAARGGHLEVLQWARAQKPPCRWAKDTCANAAKGGHLEVLQWARRQDPPCPWGTSACANAAKGGHLEVLQWARRQDPPCMWDEDTCSAAASGGHLEVLQWARENGCPWDEWTCAFAAAGGHLGLLQWAHGNGCP